jgi:hypothetical protein
VAEAVRSQRLLVQASLTQVVVAEQMEAATALVVLVAGEMGQMEPRARVERTQVAVEAAGGHTLAELAAVEVQEL